MAFKLLLADDSITIQKVVSLTFADEDFSVTCVGNGEIAVEKICELHPDIVLADIFMPRKTGYEVCDFVKKTEPYQNTPVILLVGTFEPFDKEEAANVGADGFLTKPFETTALIKMVRQALEKAKAARPAAPSLDQTIVVDTSLRESPLHLISSKPPEGLKTVQIQQENLLGIGDTRARYIAPTDLDETVIPTVDSSRSALQPDEILLDGESAAAPGKEALATEEYLRPEPEVRVTPTVVVEEMPVPVPDFTVPPPSPMVEPPAAVAEEAETAGETGQAEESGEEEAPLEAPSPLATFVNVVAPAAEEQDDVLEIQAFEKHVTLPSDEDILGIFDLIGIEDIIARQHTLEEAMIASLPAPPTEAVEAEAVVGGETVAVSTLEPVPEEEAVPEMPAAAVPVVSEVMAPAETPLLDETLVTRIARLVVEKLSEKIIRDIAWEVVPDLAELLIKKELENLKSQGRL